MNHPELYVFDGFPVLGEMGPQTDLEVKIACELCQRRDFLYHHLSYRFDAWNGEDIIKGADFYLFSERMKGAIEKSASGCTAFSPIQNDKSDHFKLGKKSYQDELPAFYKIDITCTLDGPEVWFTRSHQCERCGDQKWDDTLEGISSMITSDPSEEYTLREVYTESWDGEGLFRLQDPGPPIISGDLLQVIQGVTGQNIELREAKWA